MRAQYTALASPKVIEPNASAKGIVLIPNQFSWGAFLVPFIWLPMHRMWFASIMYFFATFVFAVNIFLFLLEDYNTEIMLLLLFLAYFVFILSSTINHQIFTIIISIFVIFLLGLALLYMVNLTIRPTIFENFVFEGFAVDMWIWFFSAILGLNCFAQLANIMRINLLQSKGWRVVGSFIASSHDDAELQYLSERLNHAKNQTTKTEQRVSKFAQKTSSPRDLDFSSENEVIGLFPKPEN